MQSLNPNFIYDIQKTQHPQKIYVCQVFICKLTKESEITKIISNFQEANIQFFE